MSKLLAGIIQFRFQSRYWWALPGLLTVCLVLIFQNCADPSSISAIDQQSLGSAQNIGWDFKVDQIAHMSCSDVSNLSNRRAFFSFRVGAYNNITSGIQVSTKYASQFSTDTPSTRIIQSLLANPANSQAQLQLAVRARNNYQVTYYDGAAGPVEGESFENILPALGSSEIAQSVAQAQLSDRTNFFPLLTGVDSRLLEGSLYYMTSETLAKNIRDTLLNDAFLSITYKGTTGEETAAAPASDVVGKEGSSVYGRGWELTFTQGTRKGGAPFLSSPTRALSAAREIDLSTGASTDSQWECPASLRFVVVRPGDEAAAGCTKAYDPFVTTALGPAYSIVRNIIPSSDWWVDWTNQCIIPRTTAGSCYRAGNYSINYTAPATSCGGTGLLECPHFLSICYRTGN